jgi:hypothetical protein
MHEIIFAPDSPFKMLSEHPEKVHPFLGIEFDYLGLESDGFFISVDRKGRLAAAFF